VTLLHAIRARASTRNAQRAIWLRLGLLLALPLSCGPDWFAPLLRRSPYRSPVIILGAQLSSVTIPLTQVWGCGPALRGDAVAVRWQFLVTRPPALFSLLPRAHFTNIVPTFPPVAYAALPCLPWLRGGGRTHLPILVRAAGRY